MAHNYVCPNEMRRVAYTSVWGRDLLGYRYSPGVAWATWWSYVNTSLDREHNICAACYEEYKYGP